jgi:hypothetical protein
MQKSKLKVTPVIELSDTDKFPFGIHQGKPMVHVPADYLVYCFEQPWISKYPAVKAYIERSRKAIDQELREKGKLYD